ncbi:hypothetical protein NBO_449g0001 [Nosema bombycis CQ1]|uniref:Uncharacterized protein n=1 Tax=Nosema bombycis (strain CQ1 / CVCC 102059) TaxID=578461 RepID=R0KNZ7_NOSB1|nr:hypothetical protein NBO_449g0001 [Nosema bombycis CQ1]|eukprot:EOB12401.1 hypothetical protein NBO_449g0001 [Nosema bombycis CQ1]
MGANPFSWLLSLITFERKCVVRLDTNIQLVVESTSPLIFTPGAFEEVENKNDGELKTYFDIDGLFGFIPCSIVNPFLLSLLICINTLEKPEIITSVKLVEVYTYFGRIGLNMNTILTINYSLIMYATLSKKNQSTKEF